MAKRKRDWSKRRWKARCRAGRHIPLEAIIEVGLARWFRFEPVDLYTHMYAAKAL